MDEVLPLPPASLNQVSSSPPSPALAWCVWQMMDSNLPTGGFAHSYGLEAAMQMGQFELKGGASGDKEARVAGLLVFARQTVQQQAMLLLPLVRAAYAAAEAMEVPGRPGSSPPSAQPLVMAWASLDRQCHALLTTEGGRRASVSQGQALLRLACDNFPTISPQNRRWLCHARDQVRGRPPAKAAGGSEGRNGAVPPQLLPVKGHQAPLFGWLCRALGVDVITTSRMFCYLVLRDLMAAATRLGLVGPLQAVRLQMLMYQDAESIVTRCLEEGARREERREPRQDNPLLDILQGAHEKLYSRLFIS